MAKFKLKESYRLLLENKKLFYPAALFFLVNALIFVFGVLLFIIPFILKKKAVAGFLLFFTGFFGWMILFTISVSLFTMLVFYVTAYMIKKLEDEQEIGYEDILEAFKKYWKQIIGQSIVFFVSSFLLSFTVIGGIILQYLLFFTPFIVVREEKDLIQAFKESISLVKKDYVNTGIMFLLYLGTSIVAGYLLSIPLIFTLPWITGIAFYYVGENS